MWIVPTIVIILSLISGPLLLADPVFAEEKNPNKFVPDRFIVVLKDDVDRDEFLKTHDVEKIKIYKHALNGLAVKANSEKIDKIRKDPRVLFVEQDKEFHILAQSLPTGINRINAELNTIAKIDGVNDFLNVDIAIVDTGIASANPDLKIAGGVNFVGTNAAAWNDGHGHGTHVAGTVAASDNAIGVVGVAPDARLWAVKVLDDSGTGTLIDIVEGIDWITANAGTIEVANLSLGGSGSDDGNCGYTNFDSFHTAICNSVAKGIVYVVAAGNSNANAMNHIPAAYDEVITVSAIADFNGLPGGGGSPTCRTDVDDTFADFSNYGTDVDIAAPGVCILSTWKDGTYVYASGTSMATPHVSGAAALYIIANGKPTNSAGVQQVKQGLLNFATPQNDPNGFTGDPDIYKEPLLDVQSISNSQPLHDVAVTSLDSPNSATQGDTVTINVTVLNEGDFSETFDLTVIDDTTGTTIGTKTNIILSPSGSSTHSFNWNTSSLVGDHTITAQTTVISGETDTTDNSKSKIVTIVIPIHDVAVSSINAPSSANKGDLVNVQVTVNNLGTFSETFDVTLTDTTDSKIIGVKTTTVGSGSSQTTSFSWDTSSSSEGNHILEAKAGTVVGETNLSDNTKTKQVTIQVPYVGPASVTITNPADSATVNGRVTVTAITSGFSGTTTVKFFVDGSLKSTDTSAPYEYGWHTKGESVGPHTIMAQASNSYGSSASDSNIVYVPQKGNTSSKSNANEIQEIDFVAEPLRTERSYSQLSEPQLVETSEFIQSIEPSQENSAPVIDPIGPLTVAEGATTSVPVAATDPDVGDVLTLSSPSLPSFAGLTDNGGGSGVLDIAPAFDDAGEYTITITATDNGNPEASSLIEVMVTVVNAEGSPVLEPIADQTTTEGLEIVVPLLASDPDGEGVLSFSAELPAFVILVDNGDGTRFLKVSPGFDDAEVYPITVTVSDNTEPVHLTDSQEFLLTVLESTPASVVSYLENQIPYLSSENYKNLGEKVSSAAQLHKLLVGAKQEDRAAFQNVFLNYLREAQRNLGIAQGIEQKIIMQDISKTKLKLDNTLEKLNIQEENENKAKDAKLLREKRQELADTINQLVAVEHFIKRGAEKEKQIEELTAKKLVLMKEVKIEEAKQSNKGLTQDDIKNIVEKIDQSSQTKSSSQDDGGDKTNKGNGNSAKSDKGKSDNANNGNGNGKSKK